MHIRSVFRIRRTVEIAGPLAGGSFAFAEVLFFGPCVIFATRTATASVTAFASVFAIVAVTAAASATSFAVVVASAVTSFTVFAFTAVKNPLQFRPFGTDIFGPCVAAGCKLMGKQFGNDDEQILIDGKRFDLAQNVHVQFVVMDIMENLLEALFRDLRTGGDQPVLHLGADVATDGVQLSHFTGRYERDGRACLAGAARTADTMDIAAGVKGQVVVENVRDIVNIQTTGGHVGGDENVDFAAAEGRHDAGALSLLHVAVEAVDIVASGGQKDVQRIRFFLRAAEDHAFGDVFRIDQTNDGIGAFAVFDDIEELFNVVVRAFRDGCRDVHGILENVLRKLDDGTRHRGGEEHGLMVAIEMLEDLLDIVQEAHVQHFIGFIDDNVFGIHIIEMAGVDQVKEAARRGDQRVDSLGEHRLLTTVGLSAREGRRMDVGIASELEQFVGDLRGKFAGGDENEQVEAWFVHDFLHGREAERGRLTSARKGLSNDITAFHDAWNGLDLDRSRFTEACFIQGLHDFRAEAEGFKRDDVFIVVRLDVVIGFKRLLRLLPIGRFGRLFARRVCFSRLLARRFFRLRFWLFFRILGGDGVFK